MKNINTLEILGALTAFFFALVGVTVLADAIFSQIARSLRFWWVLQQFIFHRHQFLGWLKEQGIKEKKP